MGALPREAVADPAAPARYAENLLRIFSALRAALKPDGRLVFSYANREPAAWMALLDALETVRQENERAGSPADAPL